MLAGRRKAPWVLLAVGIGGQRGRRHLQPVRIHARRVGNAASTRSPGRPSILLMSMSVWLRPRAADPAAPSRSRPASSCPTLAAAAALAILLVGTLHPVEPGGRRTGHRHLGDGRASGWRSRCGACATLSQERHRQSVTDELTGLGNRRHLFRVLDAFFADCEAADAPDRSLAFLFVDLNHFKEINDSFGHPAGDELLQPARRPAARARCATPICSSASVATNSPSCSSTATPTTQSPVAQRLTSSLDEPFVLDVVQATDRRQHRHRHGPRRRHRQRRAAVVRRRGHVPGQARPTTPFALCYEHDLDEGGRPAAARRGAARMRSRTASSSSTTSRSSTLRSGEILAVEALLRWAHPQLGLVPPLKFLPLAEEAGLMRPLTALVLDEASAQCAAWRARAAVGSSVSVNISATNLLDAGLRRSGRATCSTRHGLPGRGAGAGDDRDEHHLRLRAVAGW